MTMRVRVIQEGRCAIFTHKRSIEKLELAYDYIWRTWILNDNFEIDSRDDFELYNEHMSSV